MFRSHISRRAVIQVGVTAFAGALLAACAAPTPTPAPSKPAAPAASAPAPAPAQPAAAPAGAAGEVTYLHFGPSPQEMALVPPIVDVFQQRSPKLKVNYVHVPASGGGDAWQQKISTLMAAGTPPDSSQFENTLYDEWIARGVLLDLTPNIQRDKLDMNQFLPEEVRYYDREGKRYAIGYSENIMAVFYNRDLFAKAGVAPPPAKIEDIWTWSKFQEAALTLTVDNAGKKSGEAGFDAKNVKQWGANWLHSYVWMYPLMVSALGGQDPLTRAADGSVKIALDKPEVIQLYQGVSDLQHKHGADPRADALQQMGISAVQLFMTGKLAMWVTGTWAILQLNADKAFQYGVGILPRAQQPAGWVNTDSIVAFKAAKNPDGAWDWIKYWVSEEVQTKLSASGIWMPTLKSLVTPEGAAKWVKPDIQPKEYQTAVLDFSAKHGRAELAPVGFSEMIGKVYQPGLDELWTTNKQPDAKVVLTDLTGKINSFFAEKAKTPAKP